MNIFSLVLTWDNFPEGGSYATVLEAEDSNQAEELAHLEMAKMREDDHATADDLLEWYASEWEVVECAEGVNLWAAPHMLEALRRLANVGDTAAMRCSDPEEAERFREDARVARAAIHLATTPSN